MAGLCALISALTMWGATTDLLAAARLSSVRSEVEQTTARDFMQEMTRHMALAQLSAWSDARSARLLISFLLSGAAGLAFAASLRILWPFGLRREGMRSLLTRALIWTAAVRTIAGAAEAGAMRYAGESLKKHHETLPGREQWLASMPEADRQELDAVVSLIIDRAPTAMFSFAVVYTLIVAGLFVMFWRYFGREDVKKTLVAADDTPPPAL